MLLYITTVKIVSIVAEQAITVAAFFFLPQINRHTFLNNHFPDVISLFKMVPTSLLVEAVRTFGIVNLPPNEFDYVSKRMVR